MKTQRVVENLLRASLISMFVLSRKIISRPICRPGRMQEVRLAAVDGSELCTWVQIG